MSKGEGKGWHRRHPSADCRKEDSENEQKKGGVLEEWHLKDKGLKVLRRLIHNEPINKLKKLVQLGAGSIKKEILNTHKLLPKLTTTEIISELVQQPDATKFQQMDQELTNSMLFFQKQLHPNLENSQIAEIVRAQTDKCYRHIPPPYFQPELAPDTLNALLSRDARTVAACRDQLGDYYDEVEFNVNQQVNYKMRIFMNFVTYLGSIGKMADLSIQKIQGSRAKNMVVKEIVIKRAQRVNHLRQRKEEIEKYIKVLEQLKKLKKMEDCFMSQVQAKGKITTLSVYPQYCSLHGELKGYCCPRLLCKYWDVTYYMERGYQDSFCRSLKNYLGEIIVLDEKQLREVVSPSKNLFATVQDCKHIASLSDPALKLDESFEVDDDEVELVSKHNIEREIVTNFKQGLLKCTYATDDITQEIQASLLNCERLMYSILRGDPAKDPPAELTIADRKQALEKVSTMKYVRVVEQWSDRMRKVIRRQFSMIERALKACFELQLDHPQKYEIVCSYLMQIIYVTFGTVDESMARLLSCRKFKVQEADHLRQVLLCHQQWEELIADAKHSVQIWNQFLSRFVGEQCEPEHPEKENCIVEGLMPSFWGQRLKILEVMINGYSCCSLERLGSYLQEEEWKTASIPSRFYRMLGEVIFGTPFKQDLDNLELKMLSSSLLLDKNSSSYMGQSQTELEFREDRTIITSDQVPSAYPFHVAESIITIHGQKYKVLQSTMQVVEALQGYLEWVEECVEKDKLQANILSKIGEYFSAYSSHVRDLILNKGALNYGKIKSKSITGKHLLIAYSQLKLVKIIATMIAQRTPKFQDNISPIREKFDKNMADISKKFRLILQLAIRESINKLVVDPRTQINGPVAESKEIVTALHRSCDYVRDILMEEGEMGQFIEVQWCPLYLEKVRTQYKSVYKQIMNSNGSRKSKDIDWSDNIYWKFKELEYMVHNLQELRDCIPGFQAVIDELEQERKKLERPH